MQNMGLNNCKETLKLQTQTLETQIQFPFLRGLAQFTYVFNALYCYASILICNFVFETI